MKIIKYDNRLNSLCFNGLSANQLNLFMSLCYKMEYNETSLLHLKFYEMQEISNYKGNDKRRFIADLRKMTHCINNTDITDINIGLQTLFELFSTFEIDEQTDAITVETNPACECLFNDLEGEFTMFDLEEFIHLKSKHSKNLYRQLKQFRTTGLYIPKNIQAFKDVMDCPIAYSNRQFMHYCIKLAVNELKDTVFKNLKYEVFYDRKPGKPIKNIRFTFQAEKSNVEPN